MKNKALLVGINDYPLPGNDLRGCINDTESMKRFISHTNKVYPVEHIKTITNGRATKKAILQQLDWLLEDISAGDQILFQYSGHGAQQPSLHPAIEKDGLDEIICPYDFNDTPSKAISDKEFAARFAKIPQGVHFIWISDSCHAADLSRDPVDSKPVVRPYKEERQYRNYKSGKANLNKGIENPNTSMHVGKASTLQGALLSGCASHQLSADAFIGNQFNGAFTYYLLFNLGIYGHELNMKTIIQYVNIDLASYGYDQNPKIEGALADQLFFKS